MSDRRRRLLSLCVAACVLAMTGLVVIASNAGMGRPEVAAITAAKAAHVIPQSIPELRQPRFNPRDLATLPSVLAAAMAGLLAVGVTVGSARRVDDAGFDWRSLLLGAPPASSSF